MPSVSPQLKAEIFQTSHGKPCGNTWKGMTRNRGGLNVEQGVDLTNKETRRKIMTEMWNAGTPVKVIADKLCLTLPRISQLAKEFGLQTRRPDLPRVARTEESCSKP